jgi:hypothetical protein
MDHDASDPPSAELAAVVDDLLKNLESKFSTISKDLLDKSKFVSRTFPLAVIPTLSVSRQA